MNKKTLLDNMAKACDKVFEEENEKRALRELIIFYQSTMGTYPICEKVKMIYSALKEKISLEEIEKELRAYQKTI